jgi:UDP-hydrolysing UDP-N-acetyl-D-glucosamine 2-epimerase
MRRIAVFTGTRAEYGLLYWLMRDIQSDSELDLQVIVSGMHLSPEFGETWKQIESDGFRIDAKVEMLLSSDTSVGIAKSIGLGTIGFADTLERLHPDILVVLGDRFEALAVVQAAMIMRIPVAHLHGGELTEGLIDEAVRHSITKMSQLHFTSTEVYRRRVIQLGESPDRVFNFGAPGLENIRRLPLMTREELQSSLNFSLGECCFLVTYHPVTLSEDGAIDALRNLLSGLSSFPDAKIVITFPNADTHGRALIPVLETFAKAQTERALLTRSLGQLRYLSLMRLCDAVIGNSSSGLIEAPAFHVPTIDIGNRQQGRLRPGTVIHCEESENAIRSAIERCLTPEFKQLSLQSSNPYGDGHVATKIIEVLKHVNLNGLIHKRFHDLEQA